MIRFFLFLFVLIPVLEIWLLINVGSEIGVLGTIAWLILAAFLGINLIRYQGVATLLNIRQQLSMGQAPAQAVAKGMMLGVAGVLLIIPGFASDFIALLLMVPWVRRWLLSRWLRTVRGKAAYTGAATGKVYDVEAPPRSPEKAPEIGRTLEGEFHRDDK